MATANFTHVALGLLIGATTLSVVSTDALASRFGTGCQRDFEDNWQTTGPYVWDRCSGFNNELDDTDTKAFYYNLHGAKSWWQEGGDYWTLDNVDIFYSNTHGGASDYSSSWMMWDKNQSVYTTNMRLGDDSYGLSIFSTYACNTLKFNDGKMWTRMGPVFRGGLRYATGSHDSVYGGITTDEVGEDYADNLQKGKTIKYAWKDGNSDWWTSQDITVMATGSNSSNCHARRDNMKWQNFESYSRLRDGQIGYYCYSYWNNL